jgi:hypothetical protein
LNHPATSVLRFRIPKGPCSSFDITCSFLVITNWQAFVARISNWVIRLDHQLLVMASNQQLRVNARTNGSYFDPVI